MGILKKIYNWFWWNDSYIPFVLRGSIAAYSIWGFIVLVIHLLYGSKTPLGGFELYAVILFILIAFPLSIYCIFGYLKDLRKEYQFKINQKRANRILKKWEPLLNKRNTEIEAQKKLVESQKKQEKVRRIDFSDDIIE